MEGEESRSRALVVQEDARDAHRESIVEHAAELAANKAVRETFRLLGCDINEQDQVNAFRADLEYARRLRHASEATVAVAIKAVASAVAIGATALFWDDLKRFFHVG